MHQLTWSFFFKCSFRSPLPISTAFGKTNFQTLCNSCWIAPHFLEFSSGLLQCRKSLVRSFWRVTSQGFSIFLQMSKCYVRLLRYIKSNTGSHTRHVPHFAWFWLLLVVLWTDKVLPVAKMVVSIEQRLFIVKQCYKIHLSKCVCDDFIQEFPNSLSLSNHAVLNLIKKCENKHACTDLPYSEKREFTVLQMSIYLCRYRGIWYIGLYRYIYHYHLWHLFVNSHFVEQKWY